MASHRPDSKYKEGSARIEQIFQTRLLMVILLQEDQFLARSFEFVVFAKIVDTALSLLTPTLTLTLDLSVYFYFLLTLIPYF